MTDITLPRAELEQALAALEEGLTSKEWRDLVTALRDRLAQPEQEPVAVYGYCPQCGAKGVMRERRPNGNDKCANGHTYPSSTSTPPQRTWVGLTTDEVYELQTRAIADNRRHLESRRGKQLGREDERIAFYARALEAKLKEKNK